MLDSIYRNSIQLFSYRLLKVTKITKTKLVNTFPCRRVQTITSAVVRFTTTRKARVRVRVRVGIGLGVGLR